MDGDGCDNNCRYTVSHPCAGQNECSTVLCVSGACVTCTNDSQCGGSRCVTGKCVGFCGDSVLDPGEVCDDGNRVDGDGCDNNCRLSNTQSCTENNHCANALCVQGECIPCISSEQCGSNQCDQGKCVVACGNGLLDAGEQCDTGIQNSDGLPDRCRTSCRNPRCGDGVPDGNEQCDDGNTFSGDGCSAACQREAVATVGSQIIDLPISLPPFTPGTPTTPIGPVTPIATSHPPAGQTGPAAVAVMAAGAATGWAWMRRQRMAAGKAKKS